MSIILSCIFILLIFIVCYYFIYLDYLSLDTSFIVFVNFIFLLTLPLYYFYFKDLIYSSIISFLLFISAIGLNLKIKKLMHTVKLLPIIYLIIVSYINGYFLFSIISC